MKQIIEKSLFSIKTQKRYTNKYIVEKIRKKAYYGETNRLFIIILSSSVFSNFKNTDLNKEFELKEIYISTL